MPEHESANANTEPDEVVESAEATVSADGTDVTVNVEVAIDTDTDPDTDAVDPFEDVEIPEPEPSEWPEGTSPYDDDEEDQPQDSFVGAFMPRGLLAFVRSGAEAVRWALDKTSWFPTGLCQQFTRMAFNVGSGFPSAAAAWHGADKKHPTTDPMSIPPGVPVYWLGGSRGFGHAAVSLGRGLVRSTDWPSAGRVGTARIVDIWSNQRLVGWTEDINNVTVWEKPQPVLDVSAIARATRREESTPNSKLLKRIVAKEVGAGSMDLDHAVLGPGFRKQYKLVQTKYLRSLGRKVTSDAADGIPGHGSLEWLGRRNGFAVRL